MNCQQFEEDLYEYLDGTLSAERMDAVREHQTRCDACTRALQREREFGTRLRAELHAEVRGVIADRHLADRILAAAPNSSWRVTWSRIAARYRTPALACSAFLLALAAIFLLWKTPMDVRSTPSDATVDLPYETQSHVLRIADGRIVDEVVTDRVECRGSP
ncbi:MAG TPA: zf-HC2 domain-containing protein [Candidatus Didemnitutus sp.]|nr:zf-HC2 domain-containing protein [Candidatus Didemnitutus sp.]